MSVVKSKLTGPEMQEEVFIGQAIKFSKTQLISFY